MSNLPRREHGNEQSGAQPSRLQSGQGGPDSRRRPERANAASLQELFQKGDWLRVFDAPVPFLKPFLNPRDYEPWVLGWHLHFALDRESGMIVPRTAVGEATVRTLRMNDPLRGFARKLQILAGLIG